MSQSDRCKQSFLVLQFVDARLVDRVKDQRACLDIRLGVQLVVIQARFTCYLFLLNDGRLFLVRDCRVIYGRSFWAMESEVSLVIRLVFAR